MPSVRWPLNSPQHTTPISGMDAASEPASGRRQREAGNLLALARAAADSVASARRCRNAATSSAGPSEFGTITVTAAAELRLAIFITTLECASAEKSEPPYSFGMIIPMKPLSLG